jgi:hypothetical protein
MAAIDDFLAKSNVTKATPVENSIATAIANAKLGKTKYAMPSSATINGWISQFVPGIKEEYEKYFDALIAAAKAEYGENSVPVAEHVAQKAVFQNWYPAHSTPLTVDLKNSGGKTFEELRAPIDNVKKVLQEQTKTVTDATVAKTGTATQLTATNTSLYGKGTAEKPTSKSIAAIYNDAQKNLTKAQANDTKKSTAKTQASIKLAQDKYNTAKKNYDNAVEQQTSLSASNATRLSALDTAVLKSLDTYNKTAVTPFTNFLAGVPTPGPGGVQTDADTVAVNNAVETYKKTGSLPTNLNTALLGQAQKAVDTYETQKIADTNKENAAKIAAASKASIAQTRGDITGYNKLLDEARKKAPVVADTTTDLLNKMQGTPPPITTPAMGTPPPITTPVPPKFTPPPQLGLNLSNDFNTRMIQQDLAAQQQLQNPGTYTTGQFDPFYSGYLNSASQFSTQPSKMNSDGSFSGGALYRPNTGVGFGFQNAYDASAPLTPPATPVTGVAAGGYMDAQSVGQNNQALQQQQPPQNNQLGLASIPNMSQYTNYTNNPGMTSPTQNTDDGGVGGISVLGQTNPMW